MTIAEGNLRKMASDLALPVIYKLALNQQELIINDYLNQIIRLEYLQEINCINCGRKTAKSFQQGYCFVCYRRLLECNLCTIHPERCRFYDNCCKPDDWVHAHCGQPHVIYLANSSGLKVGITRATQVPTRWIDQGATQGLIIMRANNRHLAGLLEVALKKFVADKTNWRTMLKAANADLDLFIKRDEICQLAEQAITTVTENYTSNDIDLLCDNAITTIQYPIITYPEKVQSFDLDKQPVIEGKLLGIKGQYLILNSGVINLRKFSGYKIRFVTS